MRGQQGGEGGGRETVREERRERRIGSPPLPSTQPASCWVAGSPMGQVLDPRGWQVPLLPAL